MKRRDFLQFGAALIPAALIPATFVPSGDVAASSATVKGAAPNKGASADKDADATPSSPVPVSSTTRPNPLRAGDRIGIVAPAGRVYDPLVFTQIEERFKGFGLEPVFGQSVRAAYGYLSGQDSVRAGDLMRFFTDPDIQGIMALRGGWGSNRILPLLDFDAIANNPKFFCGYSDITSLHLAIHARTGLITYHGPNANSDYTEFTRTHFLDAAFARSSAFNLLPMEGQTSRTIHPGKASGPLLGGNLTVLTSLIGTPYIPSFDGAILFLEDIKEDVYRVDRMFSQLELAGVLDQISGFVFGVCLDCEESRPETLTLAQVVDHYISSRKIPSFFGTMISHRPDIFTLPVGQSVSMDADTFAIRYS